MEMETLNQLGLKLGIEAVLLINSADITVITDFDAMQFSARNRLYGKVIRVQQGAVSAEVLVLLPSGEIIAAMITEQSGQNLALAANTPVWMLFKSNTVILGSLSPR
jgi:molybdate transport system regulatory protein